MTEQAPDHLSRDEIMALKFAAHRQLARWANKPDLQPRQHAQRAALARAARILGNQAFAHGCALQAPSEE